MEAAAISLGSLLHNGAEIGFLSACGTTHSDSYCNIALAGVAGLNVTLLSVTLLCSSLDTF